MDVFPHVFTKKKLRWLFLLRYELYVAVAMVTHCLYMRARVYDIKFVGCTAPLADYFSHSLFVFKPVPMVWVSQKQIYNAIKAE